jgi:hypothetical protein
MFDPSSRYARQPQDTWTDDARRVRPYLRLREVPQPLDAAPEEPGYLVSDSDRLDRVAWQQLGDPELSWRLCDANGALQPQELTAVPGRRLVLPLDATRQPR